MSGREPVERRHVVAGATANIRAASLPFTPGADQGVFLHVSDIHFDPFVDPALVPRLIVAPVEDWAGILASSSAQGSRLLRLQLC